ncbi:MAG: hypothetical protein P4L53_10490 [Candidatus Obscuribacterales bacterium]|nr:hypothetical protein [Candidatus Obscuribacterales bacterium]
MVTVVLFTILWTGTFLHDQFAPVDQANRQSAAETTLSFDRQDKCPCVSHLHSPLLAPTAKNSCEHFLAHLMPVFTAFLLHWNNSYDEQTIVWVSLISDGGRAPKEPVYIVYRSLLI